MAPGDGRLPRRALRPDGADHEHDAREHPPARGISDLDHDDRAELRELLEQAVRPTAAPSTDARQPQRGLPARPRPDGQRASCSTSTQEPQRVRDSYGPTQFGEQCLIARRLVEAGVPFVRVGRAWWDSHGQNFETHQETGARARSRHGHAARRPGGPRPAGEHADHHAGRVRPHAGDQPQPGPRPLRHRLELHRSRAAASRAVRSTARPTTTATRSSTARSAPASCSRRSTRRWASTRKKNSTSAPGPSRCRTWLRAN